MELDEVMTMFVLSKYVGDEGAEANHLWKRKKDSPFLVAVLFKLSNFSQPSGNSETQSYVKKTIRRATQNFHESKRLKESIMNKLIPDLHFE